MTSKQNTAPAPDAFRELSDQELDQITQAFAEQVRAQTIVQRESMKTSLRLEIDAVRAAFPPDFCGRAAFNYPKETE